MQNPFLKRALSFFSTHQLLCLSIFLFALSFIVKVWFFKTHIIFAQDQARDVYLMHLAANRGEWIIKYGPKASVGNFYLPPFYYQVDRIVTFLTSYAPLAMTWAMIIVESFTPVVIYFVLRKTLQTRAALAASLLYAMSVVVVEYSTSAWNPNTIPFFSTIALLGWYLFAFEKKRWGIIVGVVATSIAIQLHYQCVVLLLFPVGLFLTTIRQIKVTWKHWLMGIFLALLLVSPYFYQEMRDNWQNTRSIVSYFTGEHSHYYDRVSKPQYVLTFLPSFVERVVVGNNQRLIYIGRILFFVGFFVIGLESIRRPKSRFFLFYFVCIFLMLRLYKGDKIDYYMSTLYILPAILAGFIVKRIPVAVIGIAGLVFLSAIALSVNPQNNDLKRLQEVMTVTAPYLSPGKTLLVSDEHDIVNTFVYGVWALSDAEVGKAADQVVTLCTKPNCEWRGEAACTQSRWYTYQALIKANGNYQPVVSVSGYMPGMSIIVGKLAKPVQKPDYAMFESGTYGSDILTDMVQ